MCRCLVWRLLFAHSRPASTRMSTTLPASPIALSATAPRSEWGRAWYQLTRNRLAVLSLAFLIGLVTLALSADVLRHASLIEGIDDQHRGSSLVQPRKCALFQ